MRLVNPIGKTPASKEDFKAYRGCTCNLTDPNSLAHQTVANLVGCSLCASQCDASRPGNLQANNAQANAVGKAN